ncbi:aldehyde ferredoxin oxidoreductase [Candidatus Bathyarchaeota archaeon]|nr:MAG: aldehyde ferredoxin oxidoreductase [Candidatus Bathyarchaeota archaeon]
MFGYAGKVLYVDLTRKKTKTRPIRREFCKSYIGGNGFAIRLLYDNTKPKIDPFSPENALVFAVGPFAGTMVPTSGKYIVQAKSPLTNFMGESISSGVWGQAFKRAGYDAVVIKGRAEKPTYLFIDDDIIWFKDAKNLWGKDSLETIDLIVEEIGDENVCPATIGPAGENLVRIANITNDKYRQAGRTGIGAVMGSKNLKAVAVRGTKKVEVSNLEKLMEVCLSLYRECQGVGTTGYRVYGTPQSVLIHNHLAALPTRNWQQSTFELAENISGEYIREHCLAKVIACAGCPIACDHLSAIEDGPYKGTTTSVEFETIYALGSNCGIGYFPAIAKASDLCDRLGIDTISAGVTIGWAMECFEKGILTKKDTDGIKLTFGNHEAVIELIKKIAYREGIGDLLAEGVKRASEKVGKGSEHFAMHNKGLELPGYDLRGLKASALGFNTSTRGGCHLRSSMYDFDAKGKIDRFKADKTLGKLVMDREDLWAIMDSLILCKFIRGVLNTPDRLAELYTLVTGIKMTADQLQRAGERIYNLEKAYNVREGWTKKDDYPPPRVMKDPIPDGVAKGSLVAKKDFDLMLRAYFKARGWSSDGIPTKQKLTELGLNKIAKDVGAA